MVRSNNTRYQRKNFLDQKKKIELNKKKRGWFKDIPSKCLNFKSKYRLLQAFKHLRRMQETKNEPDALMNSSRQLR